MLVMLFMIYVLKLIPFLAGPDLRTYLANLFMSLNHLHKSLWIHSWRELMTERPGTMRSIRWTGYLRFNPGPHETSVRAGPRLKQWKILSGGKRHATGWTPSWLLKLVSISALTMLSACPKIRSNHATPCHTEVPNCYIWQGRHWHYPIRIEVTASGRISRHFIWRFGHRQSWS